MSAMGSNQFQTEYIEYLQQRNSELVNKLTQMKENYENKIFSKDLNKHYLISTLEDALNVCTVIPQEIDLFFDKMTAAMGLLENILIRKSEMKQLVEKISRILNPAENLNADLIAMDGSGLLREQRSEMKTHEKAGLVRVSPMINGHIISTDPKIYLSRVSNNYFPHREKNESRPLSPIIEASPNTSADNPGMGSYVFRELRIPLEKLNLNKMSYNYISEESPKSRFKGPKTWKKSLSSNKRQPDNQSTVFVENENSNKRSEEIDEREPQMRKSDADPLEGPSWMFNENPKSNSPSPRSGSGYFIDYRRRKHRFAAVFDRNEDVVEVENCKGKGEKISPQKTDKLCESEINNGERESFKEILKNSSGDSEDLICESSSDNSSVLKLRGSNAKSVNCIEESGEENGFSDFEAGVKKERSTPHSDVQEEDTSQDKSDSFYEADSEENLATRKCKKSYRKRITRPMFDSVSMDQTEEKSPTKSDTERRPDDSESRSPPKKNKTDPRLRIEKKEVFVQLEDCMVTKELSKRSHSRSPGEKNKVSRSPREKQETTKTSSSNNNSNISNNSSTRSSRSKTKSESPLIVPVETEGRKRRKAAPVNLAEPKLGTKLRRG